MADDTPTTPDAAPQVPASPTPEQAPAPEKAASEVVPPSEETPDTPEKPKVPFKERFGQVYAQKKQAEADAYMARQEAHQLRAELARMRQQPLEQLPYEQQDALRVREAVKEERLAEKESEVARRQVHAEQARTSAFMAKVEEARDRMPDLVEVFSKVPVSEIAAEMIADSDKAAEIAYYLGKNPDQAHYIATLAPHHQGAEIARIEAKVSQAPTVRKTSKAPPPVSHVGGQSSPGVKDPASMSEAEYSAWYRQRKSRRS